MDRRIIPALGRAFAVAAGALLLSACAATTSGGNISRSEYRAIETALARDISILASEEFGGRRPGTPGELSTLAYMEDALK